MKKLILLGFTILIPSLLFSQTNLALNRTATANNSYGNTTPAMAVDGDMSTYWNSGTFAKDAWFKIDFGTEYNVSEIDYFMQISPEGMVQAAYYLIGKDGSESLLKITDEFWGKMGELCSYHLPEKMVASGVKIKFLKSPSWVALKEFEVYGYPIRLSSESQESRNEPCPVFFFDERDKRIYLTELIGKQCWLSENMEYEIGNSWCYDNILDNCNSYGRLYNWETALIVCPTGWHLPSDAEWNELSKYLGGPSVAGAEMRKTGVDLWNGPNDFATNSSGFSAEPGGYRATDGSFHFQGDGGNWWSKTSVNQTYAKNRYIHNNKTELGESTENKETGQSVRCVRN